MRLEVRQCRAASEPEIYRQLDSVKPPLESLRFFSNLSLAGGATRTVAAGLSHRPGTSSSETESLFKIASDSLTEYRAVAAAANWSSSANPGG